MNADRGKAKGYHGWGSEIGRSGHREIGKAKPVAADEKKTARIARTAKIAELEKNQDLFAADYADERRSGKGNITTANQRGWTRKNAVIAI